MLSSAEEKSLVARIGGDEFALFMPDCELDHGERMARHLLEIIESFSFEWNEETYRVSASMGIIRIDAATVDVVQCMALVDEACYLAKAKGRNQIYVLKAGEQEVVEFTVACSGFKNVTKRWPRIAFALLSVDCASGRRP